MKRLATVLLLLAAVAVACRSKAPKPIPMGSAIPDNVIVESLTATGNIACPSYSQPQAISGAGTATSIRTAAAAVGSGQVGGPMNFILGKPDNLSNTTGFGWYYEQSVGAIPPSNIFGLGALRQNAQGVTIFSLGTGTDGAGGGVAGAEISSFAPLSIATEGNSPIIIQPSNGTGQGEFDFIETTGDSLPALSFTNFGHVSPAANTGIIRLPWGGSSASQEITDQRNSTNTADMSITSRQSGMLTIGSLSEDNQRYAAATCISRVLNSSGAGFKDVTPAGTVANFGSDSHFTWSQGAVWPPTSDSWGVPIYQADTTSTSLATIASIPLASGTNAVTQLRATIIARGVGTGDFATFREDWSYIDNAGTITAPSGSQPAATDTGHTAGAGTSIAPQFSISGPDILVKATPWTSSAVHWVTRVEQTVDMGAAAPLNNPPGSPVMWVRADLQGLGAVSSWADQTGHAHNLLLVAGAGGTPTNTASVGPGGTLPALVFSSSVWEALQVSSALVGTDNFTIAVIGQVTATTGAQQMFASAGDTIEVGVDLQGLGSRDLTMPGLSNPNITDGPATTSWEAWVYTSDSSGNLSLMVNGANQSLSPSNAIAVSPPAVFTVGSNAGSTERLNGAMFEVVVWSTAQDNATVYAYQHTITGL